MLRCFPPNSVHFSVVVPFSGHCFCVRVVLEGGNGRVGDHEGFQMEAAVANVKQSVVRTGVDDWAGAPETLTARQWLVLRNVNRLVKDVLFSESSDATAHCGNKLNRCDTHYFRFRRQQLFRSADEMVQIDIDFNKNVHHFCEQTILDRNQTAVPVVDEEVAAQCRCGKVIHTTGAVGHVPENNRLNPRFVLDNIRNGD
jgi:hypothetical protein